MKVCSKCQKCYDDSFADCNAEDHGALTDLRRGDRTMIEGYEIYSQVESDSPVELFRATHLASEKSVLIRIIKVDDSNTELRQQLESYVDITHPGLVKVYEFGEVGQREVYIVSEDLDSRTLREYLNESNHFEEKQAIQIACQIAVGVEKLHDAGLVHRNLNPSNILIEITENESFTTKINYPDFGGSIEKKVVKEANGINAKTDIFEYYSPEQFNDEEIDFKSDLYSLAVIFYEMLLGRSPYEMLSPQAIKEYIFNEDDVDKLHHDLRALIAYTLRESLQQSLFLRPRSTKNLVRQLRHLELVATPSENFVDEEEVEIEPKWKQIIADRTKVIEELKGHISESGKNTSEHSAESVKVSLAETKSDLEQYYQLDENYDETFEDEPIYLGFVDDSGDVVVDNDTNYSSKDESVSNSQDENISSYSHIFKKSHFYIASALATVLIGGFFLITFYSWQTDATSNETVLTEKAPKQSTSETQKSTDRPEIAESQPNEIDETEQDSSSLNMASRETFERERAEVKTVSSVNKEQQNVKKVKTERVKSVKKPRSKKQIVKEKTPEKKLFEDTVIIVGNQQKDSRIQTNKNNTKEKRQKVFSDVVITY